MNNNNLKLKNYQNFVCLSLQHLKITILSIYSNLFGQNNFYTFLTTPQRRGRYISSIWLLEELGGGLMMGKKIAIDYKQCREGKGAGTLGAQLEKEGV